jgi:hypothetical protein
LPVYWDWRFIHKESILGLRLCVSGNWSPVVNANFLLSACAVEIECGSFTVALSYSKLWTRALWHKTGIVSRPLVFAFCLAIMFI